MRSQLDNVLTTRVLCDSSFSVRNPVAVSKQALASVLSDATTILVMWWSMGSGDLLALYAPRSADFAER